MDYLWITLALTRLIVDKPVDNLWKTWGGGADGDVRLLRYPHVYKKSLKLKKSKPSVNTSKLLFYLSFLRRGLRMTNI